VHDGTLLVEGHGVYPEMLDRLASLQTYFRAVSGVSATAGTIASSARRPAGAHTMQMAPGSRWSSVTAATIGLAVPLGGCAGIQSTLAPFGSEADEARAITLSMAIVAAVITIAVLTLAAHAVRAPAGRLDHKSGMRVILWLGAVVPAVLLAVALVFSLPKMHRPAIGKGDLKIVVEGEQFWWRVRYELPGRIAIETANEIRLPIGRTVAFVLTSPDVIHSFWIPGLAGKVDMIPGRSNTLVVRGTKTGIYRGACAEFCGLSHARMAFDVIAMPPDEFDHWLGELARPANAANVAGRASFAAQGCDGCHAVRGHFPGSPIGPDLTHFASRRSLGAGSAPLEREALSAFVRDPSVLKPGALMPSFRDMPHRDAEALTDYLMELR
jgi:cytochrome c oxidase subunit 2